MMWLHGHLKCVKAGLVGIIPYPPEGTSQLEALLLQLWPWRMRAILCEGEILQWYSLFPQVNRVFLEQWI